jgi:hypothetical protein
MGKKVSVGKIKDSLGVSVSVTIPATETETLLYTTPPLASHTYARIAFFTDGQEDNRWLMRQGVGLSGDAIFNTPAGIYLTVDDSPVSQYSISCLGDGTTTGDVTITIFIDMIK